MIITEKKKKMIEENIAYLLRQHELNHSACGYYVVSIYKSSDYVIERGKKEEDYEDVEFLEFNFNNLHINCFELTHKNYLFQVECEVYRKIQEKKGSKIEKKKQYINYIYKDINDGFISIIQDYIEEIKKYKELR